MKIIEKRFKKKQTKNTQYTTREIKKLNKKDRIKRSCGNQIGSAHAIFVINTMILYTIVFIFLKFLLFLAVFSILYFNVSDERHDSPRI